MTHSTVIDSGLTTTEPCQVHHGAHTPVSHLNHRHHVWPLSLGGPDDPDDVIIVCPTGHYNIHTLLDQYVVHRGEVPWGVVRRYARGERQYAKLGYERYTRGSL